MTTVEVFAPAKINLTLHVTGQQSGGYHLLDSLVVFADIGDTIRATAADRLTLSIDGPHAAGLSTDDNLVTRAARIAPGGPGAALQLTKRLPPASGIGGGSSDAAATLLALSRLRGTDLPDSRDIVSLGADLPVCLHRRPCRMQGLGDILSDVPDLPPLDVLLVNPGVSLPTPAVFKALTCRRNPGMGALPGWSNVADFTDWLRQQRNDLAPAAARLAPEIDTTLAAIRATAPLVAGMSGSGATCFGLYPPGQAAPAHAAVTAAHPDWWAAAGRLGSFPA